MPAELDVDREAVRVLVVAVGPREAARQMGLSEDTVLSWARRGRWVQSAQEARDRAAQSLAQRQPEAVHSTALKPADALSNMIAEDGKATKIAGMKYARRTVEHAASLAQDDPEKALAMAGDVKASLQSAAIAGDWQTRADGQQLVINIALLGRDLPEGTEERPPVDIG